MTMAGPILIADYDHGWPDRFRREEGQIRRALGDRALQVEHVGSTSVPGLAAKPIIDIILVVADSADEVAYVQAMESTGYNLHIREPEWHEHRLFKGPENDVNLHVFSDGCPEIAQMLAFRDWLRSHESDRDLYARAKRELAGRNWTRTQEYADAKTPVVQEILSRIRQA